MEWLVIAVITAAIVVIGAVVTFTQISRRKKANKAPFQKTYATGSTNEMRPQAEPEQTEIESSHAKTQSNQIRKKENQAIHNTSKEPIKKPSTTPQPSPTINAASQTESKSESSMASIGSTDRSHPAEAIAKLNGESERSKPETEQTVAEMTEGKAEPIEKEMDNAPEKLTAKFITEIESEPARIEAKEAIIEVETDEIEEPKKPSQKNQDDKIAELLDFGTLNDWVEIAKSPLSKDNFQIVYNKIVKLTYPRRKETKMREIFLTHANKYVDTFQIKSPVDSSSAYIYKCLAIVLQEDRSFEEALGLCQKAIRLGLDDGTKTGYPGRIERLKKAQNAKKK